MNSGKHLYLEELHRKVYSINIAICDLEVTRPGRASCEDDTVELGLKVLNFDIKADVDSRNERLMRSIRCNETTKRTSLRTTPSAAIRSSRL